MYLGVYGALGVGQGKFCLFIAFLCMMHEQVVVHIASIHCFLTLD